MSPICKSSYTDLIASSYYLVAAYSQERDQTEILSIETASVVLTLNGRLKFFISTPNEQIMICNTEVFSLQSGEYLVKDNLMFLPVSGTVLSNYLVLGQDKYTRISIYSIQNDSIRFHSTHSVKRVSGPLMKFSV